MALKFKAGDAVRQIVPVIEGTVTGSTIVGDEVMVKVEWIDAAGDKHERFFSEKQLEGVTG